MMKGCSRSHAIVDVNKVVQQHDVVIANLLGAHGLSGCDTLWQVYHILVEHFK